MKKLIRFLNRFIKRIPLINFGFYSGAFFGLLLGLFLHFPGIFILGDGPESAMSYLLEYFYFLGVFYGCAFVLLFFVGFFSHVIRRRYGFICGCIASSFCASDDVFEEDVPEGVLG